MTKEKLPASMDKGQSRDKVAEKLGISGKTYSKARKVKKSAPNSASSEFSKLPSFYKAL